MPNPSDEDLFLDGGEPAMTQVVGRYERPLYRFLLSLTGDAHLAEDLFQETFLRLHRARTQFKQGERLKPYLYRIALNATRDALERRRNRPDGISLQAAALPRQDDDPLAQLKRGTSSEPCPPESAEAGETRAVLRRELGALPDYEREVIVLRVFEDLSFQQIAEITGVPVPTAKSRMLYALRRMRPALERYLAGGMALPKEQHP